MKPLSKILLCSLLTAAGQVQAKTADLSTAEAQKEFLEEQNLYAQQILDQDLERTVLMKLAMLMDSSSPYYRLLDIQSRIRMGGAHRRNAADSIDSLCHDTGNGLHCTEARSYYLVNDDAMKVRLSAFNMHETNDDYENAVKDLDEIFGGVPEEVNLRLRYYNMMGHIEGRELEAAVGLEKIMQEFPENSLFSRRIPPLVKNFRAMDLGNRGIKLINTKGREAEGQKLLAAAIETDPTNADADYWRKRLQGSRGWQIMDKGDLALDAKSYRQAERLYRQAAEELPRSPYPYVGLARIAAAEKNMKALREYSLKIRRLAGNESPAEQARLKRTVSGIEAELTAKDAAKAEAEGRITEAVNLYRRAAALDPDDAWLRYRTASLMLENGMKKEADEIFRSAGASRLSSRDYCQPYALFLAKTHREDEAFTLLSKWKSRDRNVMKFYKELEEKRRLSALEKEAQEAENSSDFLRASLLRGRLAELKPEDPWNLYRLGQDLNAQGKKQEALKLFPAMPGSARNAPEAVKAESLLLLSMDMPKAALDRIAEAEKRSFTDEELKNRVLYEAAVNASREKHTAEAEEYINALSGDGQQLLRARYALKTGDTARAVRLYEENPQLLDNADPQDLLGAAGAAAAAGRRDDALKYAVKAEDAIKKDDIESRRDLAAVYSSLDMKEKAEEILADAAASKTDAAPGDKALVLRDLGILQFESGKYEYAGASFRTGLEFIDGAENYKDDLIYTKALQTPDQEEDWLRASLRRRGDETVRYLTPDLTAGVRIYRDSGTGGYSDMNTEDYILNFRTGLWGGTFELQTDTIHMNAGRLTLNEPWGAMYGSCFASGCSRQNLHRFTATTAALRWRNDDADIYIGTAPRITDDRNDGSWNTTDILASLSLSHKFSDVRLGARIYRRAVTGSLLSYHGDFDPGTGYAFGAARASGGELFVSYSRTADDGFWGSMRLERIRGVNIEDNSSFRIMGGWYWHMISRPNEKISLGPSVSWLSFRHDLSDYTLGQGGYYSPEFSISPGLSLTWLKRLPDWSWSLESGISASFTRDGGEDRYPLKHLPPAGIPDLESKSSRDSGSQIGWYLRGSIERRLTDRLVMGLSLSARKSPDYSPVEGTMYFRYTFGDSGLDLPMGPKVPVPFSEW